MTKQNHNQLPGALELFNPSWEAFKLNWKTFVAGYLIPSALAIAIAILFFGLTVEHWSANNVDIKLHGSDAFWMAPLSLIFLILAAFINAYIYWVKLESAKGNAVSFNAAVNGAKKFFWRLLGLSLLRGAIITLGLIAFIVPGLFLWRRLFLSPYYLMDKNIGVIKAMSMSEDSSKPFSYALWPMLGIYILISLIGNVPGIGWLISLAGTIAYSCAAPLRYLQVKSAK